MAKKASEGFTKAAQKTKFVRNRDIKMKDKELGKERKIQQLMCEGVCEHCRDKVQWRFHYDKYKPLRHPGTCQECRNKTVTKAYRTFCDPCASKKKVCPGCCAEWSSLNAKSSEDMDVDEELPSAIPTDSKGGKEDDLEVGDIVLEEEHVSMLDISEKVASSEIESEKLTVET